MPEVIRRKEVSYRWICTNKALCEQLDEQIEKILVYQSHLSSYVANREITGLECLVIDGKFKFALQSLKNERKSLWRRVRREIEEEITTDTPAAEPVEQEKYVSPFMPVNMERVL
jgi:hypothetical protein